jgi:hypothetical protein
MAGKQRLNPLTRFWMNVDKGSDNDCWIWKGGTRSHYGVMFCNGKVEAAHRLSYMWFVGEIPEGLVVCHNCDTPLCVNPKHLRVDTQSNNIKERAAKGRTVSPPGERCGKAKLTNDQVREIRQHIKDGILTHRQIAKLYGIAQPNISLIKHGKTWGRIE